MKIVLIAIGKLKQTELLKLSQLYEQRIGKYASLEIRELKAENFRAEERDRAMTAEGERVLKSLPEEAVVWALDRLGKQLSSERLAAALADVRDASRPLFLVVGGAFGLSARVQRRADRVISFSELTLPHELFRIVLLEQLFRCFKLLANEPYHY